MAGLTKKKKPRGRPKQDFRLKRVTLTLDPDDLWQIGL
jgi:hypothetical protein